MAIPDAVLLFAVDGAHARTHIEHDATRWTAAVHKVDSRAGKSAKDREVLRCREPLRLEAAHLARRSCTALSCLATDDPAHRRIVA
jgi:hypothetical protein